MKQETLAKKYRKQIMDYVNNGDLDYLFVKHLIETWNNDTPHFGNSAPHRYNSKDNKCCYCLRPKNWKYLSPNYASEVLYGE